MVSNRNPLRFSNFTLSFQGRAHYAGDYFLKSSNLLISFFPQKWKGTILGFHFCLETIFKLVWSQMTHHVTPRSIFFYQKS